ncbi:Signal peptidase complex subunit 1 [Sarcoptes scabiei]|uniref:Signal peptidase complex subunit 1 n=1 Tax=Sarcoptes scabiei TaxID=52283 RepID=A0A132AAN0_SARSC|nr:Signal peptidase complex subunit 1 [Sarcoptes scabiei]KPM08051.1 signal peptidase complex subunit 1-like protein [Sarcoptes scabiei]UXI21872.1 hypothetical protein NH340_JMT07815 [Sarcoptes scabiei]
MFKQYTKHLYMDFDGQRRAEFLFETIVIVSSLVGLGVGYFKQQFFLAVLTLGFGFLTSALLCIPPWPIYRRSPLRWQKHNPATLKEYMGINAHLEGDSCDIINESQPVPQNKTRSKVSKK